MPKFIDQGQLTAEFEGNLVYDHDEWLELRIVRREMLFLFTSTVVPAALDRETC